MADEDKVFDVAKPGNGEPSATSRPVIVGHKNMVDDPMVNASASAALDPAKEDEDEVDPTKLKTEPDAGVGPHQAKTVEPPADMPAPEEPAEPTPAPEPVDEPKPSETSPSDKPENEAKPEEKADKSAELSEEEKARQEAVQKLIESKQYVVHVGEAHHRKLDKKVVIIVVVAIILLAGLAAYLLK